MSSMAGGRSLAALRGVGGAGGPDAGREDELGGRHVGCTRGGFGLVVRSVYALTGSVVTVRYRPSHPYNRRVGPPRFLTIRVLQQWNPLFDRCRQEEREK